MATCWPVAKEIVSAMMPVLLDTWSAVRPMDASSPWPSATCWAVKAVLAPRYMAVSPMAWTCLAEASAIPPTRATSVWNFPISRMGMARLAAMPAPTSMVFRPAFFTRSDAFSKLPANLSRRLDAAVKAERLLVPKTLMVMALVKPDIIGRGS